MLEYILHSAACHPESWESRKDFLAGVEYQLVFGELGGECHEWSASVGGAVEFSDLSRYSGYTSPFA